MQRRPLRGILATGAVFLALGSAFAQPTKDPKPGGQKTPTPKETGDQTYNFPVVAEESFKAVMDRDMKEKGGVMRRQQTLLESRYDLSNRPSKLMMSGGRKAQQEGVRVKLPKGMTWEQLSAMNPAEIREKGLFPQGFLPLPHVKHAVGGQVFPQMEIDEIRKQEGRSLERFDVAFDVPEHLLPEFPPPIFLSQRPELGDVSQGKVLTIRNFYDIMNGKLTPVQMDGLRQLLTPFPQAEFNATDGRKVAEGSLGVACLDCHTNGHTNAAFHLNPDTRPQAARFRLDTTSLRGMFNQQIHGSKRSLRSIEDFTEFEQRTAYFNGDIADAAKKGVNEPDRPSQVAMMAQMQNMFDFPPAPKLLPTGRLDPAMATEMEKLGETVFHGKGQCATCHPAPSFLDNNMHDLKVERFFKPQTINDQFIHADGPIKAFTLRGIKDSPPYLHDGRLLTLEDTVEFFNLVLGLKLEPREKEALVHYMRAL
ncbi:cytochrome c peroxidase [Stigmatella aurantiaca]|uniref:Cytochrome c peroxidase n=1 Tax=Stigmatella aurantiaca TaxID=41 RepID=A0A1H7XQK6_STIAU|nr:cytochrome B6 [Stigmatella aurantiaca]SEM35269.1 cytochrome c peroxidase [Stigmatella aurantiaca]